MWKRHGVSITHLRGYLHVLGPAPPGTPSASPGITPVTQTPDSSGGDLSGEDQARLRNGCLLVTLQGERGELLARQWLSPGRQSPAVLEDTLKLAAHTTYVFDLFVPPAARRRGLGRRAVIEGEREARARGAVATFAWIERSNHASARLMTSLGYRPIVSGVRFVVGTHVRFWSQRPAPAERPYLDRHRPLTAIGHE